MRGLKLTGKPVDAVALRTLAEVASSILSAPWGEITAPGRDGSLIVSSQLTAALEKKLVKAGLDAVEIAAPSSGDSSSVVVTHLTTQERVTWDNVSIRSSPHILEAVRPIRLPGDPPAQDACFLVFLDQPGGRVTLERLLLLGRDDVQVAELGEGDSKQLAVFVSNPPLYLLMRARDEHDEGLFAYVRATGDFWVAWGYSHPLVDRLGALVPMGDRIAFVEASGRWRFAPSHFETRGIFDAIVPELRATPVQMAAAPGTERFRIPLRLDAGQELEPEVWLATQDQFLALEPMIEGSSPDEIARITVARLGGDEGVRYLIRELVRPGITRIGLRISQTLGVRGYARATGVDNLFMPVGRRLVPVLRRDDLRKLLRLDDADVVIVDEDEDGPRVISVMSMTEAPLSKWVEYVATDRRGELDQLLERSLFAFNDLHIEEPPAVEKKGKKDDHELKEVEIKPRQPKEPKRKQQQEQQHAVDHGPDLAEQEKRARARELEREVAHGGCDKAPVWLELGKLKAALNEPDDAALCLESALFYGSPVEPQAFDSILAVRGAAARGQGTSEEVLRLAVAEEITPAEAAYLGVRTIQVLRQNDVAFEEMVHHIEARFTDPNLRVPRRLAWLVLSMCLRRSGDTLGMTRAKEKILGAINDRGLSETYDVPRFVRSVLALETPDNAPGSIPVVQAAQIERLEVLWRRASSQIVALDPKSAYLRMAFAMGFVRVGQTSRAREITAPVEDELNVHEVPNRALFRLYLARIGHIGTGGDDAAWATVVDSTLKVVPDDRMREKVEWLRKRSVWLNPNPPEEPKPWIRGNLERLLVQAETQPTTCPDVLRKAFAIREMFDYEATSAIERSLKAALRTGVDALIDETRLVAYQGVERIHIPGHRVRAIGACVSAAAAAGDGDTVDALLDEVVRVVSGKNVPSVRDLLTAVQPALEALRRVGVGASGKRFLDALVPVADAARDRVLLRAALADGFRQIGEMPTADDLLNRALHEVLHELTDHVKRFEGGSAVLEALKHWSFDERLPRVEQIIDNLEAFRDTFTVGRFYRTHQVLIGERFIDTVVDQATFKQDVIKGFLFSEEQAIRRRILNDWRDACGRLESSNPK